MQSTGFMAWTRFKNRLTDMRETFIPSFAKILVTAMTLKFASLERETTRLRAYNDSFPIIELKFKPT